jgi:hypothetical protein
MEGRNLKKIMGTTGNLEFRITESMITPIVVVIIIMMMTKGRWENVNNSHCNN